MGCHVLLQGIFPLIRKESNPRLLLGRPITTEQSGMAVTLHTFVIISNISTSFKRCRNDVLSVGLLGLAGGWDLGFGFP